MKYDVIIFDADETLFDFKKSEKEAFKNTMLQFDLEYDENYHFKIYHEINAAIWKEFEVGLITQEKLKEERFIRLSKDLKIDFDTENFAKAYMKHLGDSSILYKDSKPLIESLYGIYKLLIVTNGLISVQSNRIRKSDIAKYFDEIVISEEVGLSKPNPEIFQHSLKNIRCTDKSRILIVGDGLTSDILGGINYGIDTCWYNPNKLLNKTEITPNYEISSLFDLNHIL
ncbi:MAG: YjjG family noncanonical pyrimidine nucleotidase [Solirubrobacterales bacterium]